MKTSSIAEFLEESFDILIVGGGTAGSVLASRLSENPEIRVGLIEAGHSRLGDPNVELPTAVGKMLHNPAYDWTFKSISQIGTGGRVYHIPRGKMLGGSSGINFMSYGRPSKEDITQWSDALGITGWSWPELLSYFKRTERLELDQPNIHDRNVDECPLSIEYHGLSGAIHTSFSTWSLPLEKDLLRAFDEVCRQPRPEDPYSGRHLGFYRSLFTTDRTEQPIRSYALNGYLAPVSERRTLKVLTGAVVCKILLKRPQNGEHGLPRAAGVEFLYEGAINSAFAKHEVIISAGAIQSPQLLELSGIGDPRLLGNLNIPCFTPNPNVGNNLQEHTMSAVVYELNDGILSLDGILRNSNLQNEHHNLYTNSHSGAFSGIVNMTGCVPYSSLVDKKTLESMKTAILQTEIDSSIQNAAFQKKQKEAIAARLSNDEGSADIQFVGTPGNFDISKGYQNCSQVMPGSPSGYNDCYSITVSNMYPISRGSVHIQWTDVLLPPAIDLGILSHPTDVEIMAAGLKVADKVFQSPTLEHVVKRRVNPPTDVDLSDGKQAAKYVREHVISYHHALGTCAIGQVVDDRLCVKGVDGLRVVDASVLPMQVSCAIMATIYAVAEKAADIIHDNLRSHFIVKP